MPKISEEAKKLNIKRPFCIECGKRLKDYRSLRCRRCYYILFRELKPLRRFGSSNGRWKGNKVSYSGLHKWVNRHKKKMRCEICGSNSNIQASNISGKYLRDVNDYRWVCARCHTIIDGTINNLNYNRRLKKWKNKKS